MPGYRQQVYLSISNAGPSRLFTLKHLTQTYLFGTKFDGFSLFLFPHHFGHRNDVKHKYAF